MPTTYRRPGVYLEESLLVNPVDVAGATSVACFVGMAPKGPINDPTRIESWSDYVTLFGNFDFVSYYDQAGTPPGSKQALSYLPYAVYSFFQNGGRIAFIIRSVAASPNDGEIAEEIVTGTAAAELFTVCSRSVGVWGNDIAYSISIDDSSTTETVFQLQVYLKNSEGDLERVEVFRTLSLAGTLPGTKRVDSAINDPYSGSRYVYIKELALIDPPTLPAASETDAPVFLTGGTDPNRPLTSDLLASAGYVDRVEGPVMLNIVGYLSDASQAETDKADDAWVGAMFPPSTLAERNDIFVINDNCKPRIPGQTSEQYYAQMIANSALGADTGNSYTASYGPWLIVPNPKSVGSTITIPPGGAVMGMTSRIDSTIGFFRAPAGVIAGLSNAVGVQTKFKESTLGDLNHAQINVIRSVAGAGICVMGARTRKAFGADRYVSGRRTLIYLREVLKRSTQFAVFENNDQRLWASLRMSADRILRPLWEAGGLRGASASEAYYIRCDDSLNTPDVISSGEVRMELGVALEYPAEFVVIKLTQFEQSTYSSEVSTAY